MSVYTRCCIVNKLDILCRGRHMSAFANTNLKDIKHNTASHPNKGKLLVDKKMCIHRNNYQCEHSIYNTFTSSATIYGPKKHNTKSGKNKNKNTSALDDLLDEISDDEDEETKGAENIEVQHGRRTPAALFVDGMHKGGASKGKV